MKQLVTHHAVPLGAHADASLPTSFRIFAPGVNQTTKGPDIFDAKAARDVMAAYRRQGVDQMIDLQHDSLDPATRRARADAGDAMGWYKLELRGDGSLWAVDVRWSDEGAARLRAKKQRYISPAFFRDKSGRVLELLNCALVSMPATHSTEALVAASRTSALGRKSSAVLHTRVPVALRARVYEQAARLGVPAGVYLRSLVTLAASPGKPEKALAAVAHALGLDASIASPDQLKQALEDLIQLVAPEPPGGDDSGGATGEVADAPPPPAPKGLSKTELAGIKRLGISAQEFRARKAGAAKRSQ